MILNGAVLTAVLCWLRPTDWTHFAVSKPFMCGLVCFATDSFNGHILTTHRSCARSVLCTPYSVMNMNGSAPGLRVPEEATGQSVILSQAVPAAVGAQALSGANSGSFTSQAPIPPCFRLGTIPGDSEALV